MGREGKRKTKRRLRRLIGRDAGTRADVVAASIARGVLIADRKTPAAGVAKRGRRRTGGGVGERRGGEGEETNRKVVAINRAVGLWISQWRRSIMPELQSE